MTEGSVCCQPHGAKRVLRAIHRAAMEGDGQVENHRPAH